MSWLVNLVHRMKLSHRLSAEFSRRTTQKLKRVAQRMLQEKLSSSFCTLGEVNGIQGKWLKDFLRIWFMQMSGFFLCFRSKMENMSMGLLSLETLSAKHQHGLFELMTISALGVLHVCNRNQ